MERNNKGKTMRSLIKTGMASLALAASLACVPVALADENWQEEDWGVHASVEDPWEHWNRKVFALNETLDRWALRPVAVGYQKITHPQIRRGVRNVFNNLGEGKNLVNNLLQAKFHDAGVDTARFMFNTSFGVLGIFDVATRMGLPRNDEDFGQTLGAWGVPGGPYLMLPLLGPSTLRDAPALVPDYYSTVYPYMRHDRPRYGLTALDVVSRRQSLLSAETMIGGGDKYGFIRNAWLQSREYRVRDGVVEDDF